MSDFNSELARMQQLISFGRNTKANPTDNAPVLEHAVKAADGNTYGILRECQNYYIMVAPPKNSAIVAEDFDYLGGSKNKKEYEYRSYSSASQDLELKVRAVNEAVRIHNNTHPTVKSITEAHDWQTIDTKELRGELDRFHQIMNNVALIENKYIPTEHTLPEAPAKNPSDTTKNGPFVKDSKPEGDKDLKATAKDPKAQGAPFEEKGEASDADMQNDKNPSQAGDDSKVFTEKPKYAPENNVTTQHPEGGKVTRADESKKHSVRLTEAQAIMWQQSDDFKKKYGSTVSDDADEDAPFDIDVNVNEDEHVDADEVAGMPDDLSAEANDGEGADGPFSLDDPEFGAEEDMEGLDADNEDVNSDEEFENWLNGTDNRADLNTNQFGEARARGGKARRMNEGTINDYGKHPSFRKAFMTLPTNTDSAPNGARDWNDDSTKSEQPYASKMGNPAPFVEVVKTITDSLVRHLNFQDKA